jgi:small subunit ribosomal protein S8
MTMTDPIADMLTRLRNANTALHDDVSMPSSKVKEALAALLLKEGYIADFRVAQDPKRPGNTLTIDLKYSPERKRVIQGVRRVSKPGLRLYTKADGIPRVLGGLGVAVVSTSKGLMTDRDARKASIGGEVICYVW